MNHFFVGMFVTLYSAMFELARRLVFPLFAGRERFSGWDFDKRNSLPRIVREHRSRTVVWVHAASLGEAKLLLQFVTVLEERNPDDCYVVTATSRTGVDYLERMKRPSVYAVGFLPFDTMPLMKSLIKTFGISRLWLLETELWPSMLFACFRGKVPVGIANARIEEKSFASYLRLRRLFGPLLGQFDVVLAQNDTYAERFRRLGVRPECLHVVGNMKGHIIFHRPAPDKRAALRRAMHLDESDIVLTAGCFHRGEGGVLRACLDLLKGRCRAVKCIVVPRYLDESDALAAELGKAGLRRFADMVADAPWELCTVEKIGILEAMYSIADAAAVGGTFVDIGGHNVWEPARFGIPVFFGPHYHTQSSSCEKLLAAGTGFCVNDAKELADGIERTLWREKTIFAAAQSLFVEQITHDQMIAEPLIP